ncbi:hypothetical protein ZWY2020_051244 [Hordeum vulgare]|nr:hypothetical protein ZWY2020_051244 [Hordeum vulgare]
MSPSSPSTSPPPTTSPRCPPPVASSYTEKYVLVEATPNSTPTSAHDPPLLGCTQKSAAKESGATSNDAIAELMPPSTPSIVFLKLASSVAGDLDQGVIIPNVNVYAPPLIPLAAHPAESQPPKVFSSLSLQPEVVLQSLTSMHVMRSTECLFHDDCSV